VPFLPCRSTVVFAFAGTIGSLMAAPLGAQDPTASISGFVRDSAGIAIEGAIVEAYHRAAGFAYRTVAGSSGAYWLEGLPAGPYDVRATRVGYGGVTREGAALRIGRTATLDFQLPGQAVELETLVVEGPLLESTPDVGYVIDPQGVRRIPDASRQMAELALLVPGATSMSNGPAGGTSDIALGGLNANSTAVRLDGASLNEPGVRNAFSAVPRLAVDELQVLTTSYSAEFGQTASGTLNATTRRGTNEWIAEGLALTRNEALTATNPFAVEDPDFRRDVVGFALGGPIRRDRTHFFVAIEATDELAAGVLNTMGAFPQFDGNYDLPADEQLVMARMDHRLSDAHEVMVRYSAGFNDQRGQIGPAWHCTLFGGPPLASPNFGVDEGTSTQSVLARHRWATGATSLNQATLHYLRVSDHRHRLTAAPALQFQTLCDGGNFFDAEGDAFRLELEDAFSLALSGGSGEHRLKVGGRVSFTGSDRLERTFSEGIFIFSDDGSTEPESFGQSLTPLVNDERNTQIGLFVQDDWRPTPALILNLGLRYDVETNGTNQDFVGSAAGEVDLVRTTPRPIDADNLAPRLGVAWDIGGDGRTVVRGGFGIFYDQHWLWRSAFESGLVGLDAEDPGTLDISQIEGETTRTIFPFDSVMPTPFTRQVSLGIERLLPFDVVARLDGLLVRGRNLPVTAQRDVPEHTVDPDPDEPPIQQIVNYQNSGRADTEMLMLHVRRESESGGVGLAYTLADRRTTVDSWFDFLGESAVDDEFANEMAPTDWDERHRLVLSGWTRLPAGLEAGLKLIYASARPYTLFDEDNVRIGTRNGARGADFFTTDLGLTWTASIDRVRAGVVLNVYNVLNRTNFDPASYVGHVASPLFSQPTAAFPRRQVELGLRAAF